MKTKRVNKIKVEFKVNSQEERQTIVKLTYSRTCRIRIWPTTFLKDTQSNHTSKLIEVYNVTKYPTWSILPAGKEFTLVFDGLPIKCTSFHLVEEIPEPYGMCFRNIGRNSSDVYQIKIE